MAVSFRAASGGQSTTTSLSASVTQPSGAVAGDMVIVGITVKDAQTFTAKSGWTLEQNPNSNSNVMTTATYTRVLDGTESWPIAFAWTGSSVKYAWVAAAFSPAAGNVVALDGEAAVKVDTTSTTHTANAQTAVAASVCSVIFNLHRNSSSGSTGSTVTPPTNWTEPTNGDQTTAAGTTTALSQVCAEVCYCTGQSGTVTPGSCTLSLTGTQNTYHFLLKETPETSNVSGGPKFKKMQVSGSGTAQSDVSGGPKFKKMQISGSGTGQSDGSGASSLKKMKVSGVLVKPKTLSNSLEGISQGTAISPANSGGISGTAFDSVTAGSGATLTSDNTHPAHGSQGMKFTTPATATYSFAYWGAKIAPAGGNAQLWFRFYLYLEAVPAGVPRLIYFWTGTNGSGSIGGLVLNANGTITFLGITSTTVIPTGQQVRIEGYLKTGSGVGQTEFKIFLTADSDTPDETKTSTLTTYSAIGSAGLGPSNSVASVTYWLDDPAVSNIDYIGKVVTAEQSDVSGGPSLKKMTISGSGTVTPADQSDVSGGPSLKKMTIAGSGTGLPAISGGPKLKKMTIACSATGISAVSGGPKLKKMGVSGSATKVSSVSGGPSLKKMSAAGSGTGISAVSGGPKLKKMGVAGSGSVTTNIPSFSGGPALKKMRVSVTATKNALISGGPKFKKIGVAVSATGISSVSGAPRLKKMGVSGAATKISAVSGGPKLKKMTVAGSATKISVVSGGPLLKKMRIAGSGTVTTPVLTLSGSISLRKMQAHGSVMVISAIQADNLFVFSPL
jgi:hypothetical protein